MNRDEQKAWDAFVAAESGGSWLDEYIEMVAHYETVVKPKWRAAGRTVGQWLTGWTKRALG